MQLNKHCAKHYAIMISWTRANLSKLGLMETLLFDEHSAYLFAAYNLNSTFDVCWATPARPYNQVEDKST